MRLNIQTAPDIAPEQEIRNRMMEEGIVPPAQIQIDGRHHRFRADSDKGKGNDAGWYIFSDPDAPYGAFGSWIGERQYTFVSGKVHRMAPEERLRREAEIAVMAEQQRKEREAEQEKVAEECTSRWEGLPEANTDNFYIQRKGLRSSYGAKASGGALVLPLYDRDGKICSLQYISESGKKYQPGGKVKGCYWCVGEGAPRFLAEGFATAASVYEATGKPCLVAFSAGNLKAVHDLYPATTIVADNDESQTGETKAKEATDNYILIPEVGMDANDYAVKYGTDSLRRLLVTEPSYRLISGADCLSQPTPRRWIIRDKVPEGPSFTMIYGDSGNGKTFVTLDMMLRVATGLDWYGKPTRRTPVLYLCGEDSIGVRARIAAWCQVHDVGPDDLFGWFYMSEEAVHLDTEEGIQKIMDALEWNAFMPGWIVTDTLNRFMEGDENKTVDAGLYISSCMRLANAYRACVTPVHHTGLAENAQGRARGSSAFRGALDTQDYITRSGDVFTITQTKNKSGRLQEPFYLRLVDHQLDGWLDEDGNPMNVGVLEEAEEKPQDERPKQQMNDEKLAISAFSERGDFYFGRPYLSYDCFLAWLSETKPGDSDDKKKEAARKDLQVSRIFPEKPRLMDRLISYGDIEPERSMKGAVTGFFCNPIVVNGIVEPNFTMNMKERIHV